MNTSQKNLFIQTFLADKGINDKKFDILKLAGDGSTRMFERIQPNSSGQTYIFMENHPSNDLIKKENLAYLKIGKHLFSHGIPVPEMYSYDLDEGLFILEDMGNRHLQEEILNSENRIPLYEKVLEILLRIQVMGKEGFNPDWCCQSKTYDASLMREKEAHYFRDSFLANYMKLEFDAASIEKAFDRIIMMADKSEKTFLLHRDFQSRNIMCREPGGIAILDWQGARLGPLAYDLASLLFDPYSSLSTYERDTLFEAYSKMLEGINRAAVDSLKFSYNYIAIMRLLQALGAYSNLSSNQGKTYFEKYIPPALNSLKELIEETGDPELSYLEIVIKNIE